MERLILASLTLLFSLIVFFKRKKFFFYGKPPFFYFGLYKTKFGINLMNKTVKNYSKILEKLVYLSIITCFLGMILVSYDLLKTVYKIIFTNYSGVSVGLVLPVKAKGIFYVPIIYWIISIVFLAIIHEFAHGIIARLYKVKIKSTGFAFLGFLIPIIPAAFVEPDEKKLIKKSVKEQLGVFSAGPFINIVFGLLFMLLFSYLMVPLSEGIYNYEGLEITKLFNGFTPAKSAGLMPGEVLKSIDNKKLSTVKNFKKLFVGKKEGDVINLVTDKAVYNITLGNNGLLGVFVREKKSLINNNWYNYLIVWFENLIYWLFLLNLGVGFFNLIPIGPIDGGRMLHVVLQKFMPHKHARRIWYSVSFVFLISILGSVLVAFI